MTKIRSGIFETNSSSSHAIVVMKDEGRYTQDELLSHCRILEDGIHIYALDAEFGRDFNLLDGFWKKLCFAIASFFGNIEMLERIVELLKNTFPGIHCLNRRSWRDSVLCLAHSSNIDHQSQGLLQEFLDNNNVLLEDFLLSKRYVVMIDSDERRVFDRLQAVGLINDSAIEKVVGVYDE